MDSKAFSILQKQAGWQVSGDPANGASLRFAQDGVSFIDSLTNRLDDHDLEVTRCRAYHKSGCAINDMDATVADGSAAFSQTVRFATNVARICTDVTVRAGCHVAQALSVGSLTLPGRWTRLTVFDANGVASSRELVAGGEPLRWGSPVPLVWLLEREDGFRCEIGTGFDCWRWHNGLGLPEAVEITLTVQEGVALFDRAVVVNHDQTPDEDGLVGLCPQPRVYRFCHYLAWSTSACAPRTTTPPPVVENLGSAALGETPAVSLDLNALSLPVSARVDGQETHPVCWESRVTLAAAKRIIRQLNAYPAGRLHFSGGLTPALCANGSHVERPKHQTCHWDHNAIVCFSQWARQLLGRQWDISCAIDGDWTDLPSLQGLFAPNGFSEQDRD